MNTLVNQALMLVAGGAAAYGLSCVLEQREGEPMGASPVVVVAPQRTTLPNARAADIAQEAVPHDQVALARALQRELKRVGCYGGEVSGHWGREARAAMRAFTDAVNAKLPVDQPDPILLRLVQTHELGTCACPEPATGAEHRCAPSPTVANQIAPRPYETVLAPDAARMSPPRPARATPLSLRTTAEDDEKLPTGVASEEGTGRDRARGAGLSATADLGVPTAALNEERPVAAAPVSQRAHKRSRWRSVRPPRIVRSLMRNVERSLAPLGVR